MSLEDDGTERIIPETRPSEYDSLDGMMMAAINLSVNSIYDCDNKEQLTNDYHTSFSSHVKQTLAFAAKEGYLQGCPGFTVEAINKHISVENATEMGHMRKAPAGVRSTTTTSKRGRTPKENHPLERLNPRKTQQQYRNKNQATEKQNMFL